MFTLTLPGVAFGLSVAANVLLLGVWLITLARLNEVEISAEIAEQNADDLSAEAEYRLGENIALRQQIAALQHQVEHGTWSPPDAAPVTQADDLPVHPASWYFTVEGDQPKPEGLN